MIEIIPGTELDGPPSDERIAELERYLEYALPDAYIAFLKATNGGKPVKPFVEFAGENAVIRAFLGIQAEVKDNQISMFDIEWTTLNLSDEFPMECVPIAADDFGNYIALHMHEGRPPSVVFVDHEMPSGQNLVHLADSFEGLETILKPLPDHG